MRRVVIEGFSKAPGLPRDRKRCLGLVDDIYKSGAYHSLSIEGYIVNPASIERVQRGDWDLEHHDDDRKNRDALMALGCEFGQGYLLGRPAPISRWTAENSKLFPV